MFCPKCGTQALDGATFCQKCGAKLIVGDTEQQAVASTPVRQTQPPTPLDTPKKKKSKKLPIIIGAVALAIVAVIVIAMNWNGKIDYEATVRAHQPFVSQGTSLTYGEVLDKYISSPDWKVRHSGDVSYVDISGKAKGTDNELLVTIKVTPDEKDPDIASIAPESVTVDNEKSPTQNDAVEFLLAMFLAYDRGDDDLSYLLSDDTANKVLYKGVPVDQLLGASPDDFISIFGEPDTTNYGGEELIYGNVTIYIDMWSAGTPYLCGIYSGALDDFTYNGQPLSDDYDKLTQILGREPDEARVDYDAYCMTYRWDYMGSTAYLTVETPATEGSPAITQVGVSWWADTPQEGQGGEDEGYGAYAPAAQMDASLYGRWRAADGTSIAFDEYGGAQTNMELRPWWAIGKSTALSWEASNGQLKLITSYSAEYKYTYYPDTGEIGARADQLQVGSLFLHRVNGNTGDSMIGVWDDNDMGGPYFTFNADGTGAFANDKPTTWVADEENVYIYYSLYGTYDYYVSGDMLELFFSDGSKTFIKVGN